MKLFSTNSAPSLLAMPLAAILLAAPPIAARSQADAGAGAAAVKQINTECGAIQDALTALHPISLVYAQSTWKVASDADVSVAERTHASVTIANVWKQGKDYAWVHAHTFDQQGDQRATQLCFRQKDGSLERVRQAATVPDLSGAAAEQAYYGSDGALIQKTGAFEVNDPMIAKKVADLPFYKTLP